MMSSRKPNATKHHTPDAASVEALLAAIPLPQQQIAERIGLPPRTLRHYKAQGGMPYVVQYALEGLAGGSASLHGERNRGADRAGLPTGRDT